MGRGILKQVVLMLLPALSAGCDDGKIYPSDEDLSGDSGLTVVMTGSVSGVAGNYDEGYSLVLAAFEDGNDFAVVSKTVHDGADAVELTKVSPSVNTIELCVINNLRKRIMTLASVQVSGSAGDRINFEVGDMDAAPFSVIEKDIFSTTCIQCHGATGHAAAGLDLQPSMAYRMLVNVPSVVVEGDMRVNPGDVSSSTLWQAVASRSSQTWSFDHSNLLTAEKSGFIENWINNLKDD